MSSEAPCRREWLAFLAIVAATLAALALRLPGTLEEARALATTIELEGVDAAVCGTTLPGGGELAAAVTALEALQGRDAGLACTPPRRVFTPAYLRFAAS